MLQCVCCSVCIAVRVLQCVCCSVCVAVCVLQCVLHCVCCTVCCTVCCSASLRLKCHVHKCVYTCTFAEVKFDVWVPKLPTQYILTCTYFIYVHTCMKQAQYTVHTLVYIFHVYTYIFEIPIVYGSLTVSHSKKQNLMDE